MKSPPSLVIVLVLLLVLGGSGCAGLNQKNAAAFLNKINKLHIEAADISQSTVTPFYNHTESVAGLKKAGSESISIENLKASFNIPLPVFNIPLLQFNFSASSIVAAKNESALAELIGGDKK